MKREFTKMHGLGNDYIYFNCLTEDIPHPEALAVRLSDRHFGIGGDGIILLCSSDRADVKMRLTLTGQKARCAETAYAVSENTFMTTGS